ncbi:hypothetical protein FBULB1_4799 [Fusarium bulbicola]|nr:hypothetical protein FBULB1_4799 [Fusarium bulbicola]
MFILFLFELMHGNTATADRMLTSSVELLRHQKDQLAEEVNEGFESQPEPIYTAISDDGGLDQAERILPRLQVFFSLNSCFFPLQRDCWSRFSTQVIPCTVPSAKTGFNEFAAMWNSFITRAVIFVVKILQDRSYCDTFHRASLMARRDMFLKQLHQWEVVIVERLDVETNTAAKNTTRIFHVGQKVVYILLNCCLDPMETEYDKYDNVFADIMGMMHSIESTSGPSTRIETVLDIYVLPVLNFVSQKCRSKVIRLDSLNLFEKMTSPMGGWETRASLLARRRLMSIEEDGRDENGVIPAGSRYIWTDISWDKDQSYLIVYFHEAGYRTLCNKVSDRTNVVTAEPKATFLGLPLELRQQIYHEYFKVDGGYVYDGDSDKLVQADRLPISISLRYTCRSVAEETRSFPFKLYSITFSALYRKDLQHQAAIHSNLIRFHTVLLSELLLRMRRCVTPEMFDQVEEVAPQYVGCSKQLINIYLRTDGHPRFPPVDFQAVANFDHQESLTKADLGWGDSTVGFQRAIVCILHQINVKNAADITEAIDEVLPEWSISSSPEELFDMSFDHWDFPRSSASEKPQSVYSGSASWKAWRGYLRKLILNEDSISVGFPESHAIGMIPFRKENPKLHLEQRIDVWHHIVTHSRRPTAYRLANMYFERSEPEAGEFYSLDDIFGPGQDSDFTNWVVHGLEVVKAGMPEGSWSVVFDGEPDLNLATDLFTTLLKRTIVWQTFFSDCVSSGLFTNPTHPDYPFATIPSDGRAPESHRSSIFQCNFNLDRPWNLDEIAADHNIHNDRHERRLDFWLSTVNSESEAIDFHISSPTVNIRQLCLGCFERERISDD